MSAIIGRMNFDGTKIDEAEFRRAWQKLRSYGADNNATAIQQSAAVGFHFLEVNPSVESTGVFGSFDSTLVVADAILDNRPELLRLLGRELDSSCSNAEIIHNCFVRWGEECVDRLEGDFAFVCIQRSGQRIFLARDHIGARPLYWTKQNGVFLFATSVEAIVAFDQSSWKLNEAVISEYLAHASTSDPLFRNIHAVPPGGFVAITGRNTVINQWWDPTTISTDKLITEEDAVAECRRLLEKAIAARVDTTYPVASHISGGLDSTGITILASRILRSQGRELTRAYAWAPEVSQSHPVQHTHDERLLINDLSKSEALAVRYGVATSRSFLRFLKRPIEFERDADLVDELTVLDQAHEDSIRILLSGWGGDEAFSSHGHGYFGFLVLKLKLRSAKAFARACRWALKRPSDLISIFWNQVLHPLLPDRFYHSLAPWQKWRRRFSLISPSLNSQHKKRISRFYRFYRLKLNPADNLKRLVLSGYVSKRMETWSTWSAEQGIQYRYPLLDRRLLEFLFSLPAEYLFLGNKPRGLAKEVLKDCKSAKTHKRDYANEKLRNQIISDTWNEIAKDINEGKYDQDCPWIDTTKFRIRGSAPIRSSDSNYHNEFLSIVVAARAYRLYFKSASMGWLDQIPD